MTGWTTVTSERRRSLIVHIRVALAVVVVAVLGAACGSDDPRPADPPPEPGTPVPDEPPAGASPLPAPGEPAVAVAPEITTQPAPAPPPTQPAPSPQPPVHLDTSGLRTFPAPEVWEALRQCQSQGDYAFVHPSGEYFGAYQFTVATWDRLANQRYTELLGILPSEAEPAEQDRMAFYLWIESGHTRWPACSHVFTGDSPPSGSVASGSDTSGSDSGSAAGEGPVEGVPFEPAPGDDRVDPVPPPGAAAAGSGDTGATATTSVEDLPGLEIDPAVQPAIPPDVEGFPTPEQWEALRFCESSGNYRAVSRNGLYYGAYQFWPDTWDFVAKRNYPRLVGILPSAATTHDQDRMAYRLWEERGDQPWPVCGRYLRPGA